MILEVKPKTNASCGNFVSHEQHLLLGSMDSIYCPGLSHQTDAPSPEVTWYQVRMISSKLMPEYGFMVTFPYVLLWKCGFESEVWSVPSGACGEDLTF